VIAIEDLGLVRIDDRLIHGQVIAVWCRHQSFNRIVIIDDGVAADSFMQDVLRLSAPPGLRVEAFSVAEGIKVLSDDTLARKTTMVLVKSPQTARRLYDGGFMFGALNVGGIGHGPGRKNIFKNISASAEEIAILKELMNQGVKITLLTVPGEKAQPFSEIAGRL
jgi:PTS system mannose-specific IIB component